MFLQNRFSREERSGAHYYARQRGRWAQESGEEPQSYDAPTPRRRARPCVIVQPGTVPAADRQHARTTKEPAVSPGDYNSFSPGIAQIGTLNGHNTSIRFIYGKKRSICQLDDSSIAGIICCC